PAVAATVPIRRLLINEHFEDMGSDQPAVGEFLAKMHAAGVPIDKIAVGWRLAGSGATLTCLWPPPAGAFIPNDNSSSTVLRLEFGGHSMLLTGDIDRYALDQLTDRGGLACEVMQLPHHGSVTESTEPFLTAAASRICIRS